MKAISREEFQKRMHGYFIAPNAYDDMQNADLIVFDRKQFEKSLAELQKALDKFPQLPSSYGHCADSEQAMFHDLCAINDWHLRYKKVFSGFQGTFFSKVSLRKTEEEYG